MPMKRTSALCFLVVTFVLCLAFVSCSSTSGTASSASLVQAVRLDSYTETILYNGTATLNSEVKFKSGVDGSESIGLIWSSSDESVLEVSDGVLVAHNSGPENVTVKVVAALSNDPSKSATCTVTVLSSYPHLLMAGPGQDSSTEAVISWLSPYESCTLEHCVSGSSSWTSVPATGVMTTSDWADIPGMYRYSVELSDLVPGSAYSYKVSWIDDSGEALSSDVSSFSTAGSSGSFSFAWLSDRHINVPDGMGNIVELLSYFEEQNGPSNLDFCLFSGDMVNKGQVYLYWDYWTESGLLDDMQWAFLIGNHEYYPKGKKGITANSYFLDAVAIPDNSLAAPDSCYWFIHDGVLFICMDSMAPEATLLPAADTDLAAQVSWFEDVVSMNAGRFRYLVAVQHYAFLDGDEDGVGNYRVWQPVFDRCGVDLALASDTHSYTRSLALYGDAVSEVGTVYVTSPETEGKGLSDFSNAVDKLGSRAAYYTDENVVGGVWFEVNPECMTMHVIGKDGVEFDSVSITSRR